MNVQCKLGDKVNNVLYVESLLMNWCKLKVIHMSRHYMSKLKR